MFDNKFPRIPREEYKERWKKVQSMMSENNLDILIAYSNDREVFGQAHARWLCDFPTHLEPILIIFNRDCNPVIATGPESKEFIFNKSTIDEVYILREFIHPEEVYNLEEVLSIEEIISQRSAMTDIAKVGIAGLNIMDLGTWQALQNFLKDREWVDVEENLSMLRMIKSQAEVEVMRFCYQIAEKAFNSAIEIIMPGKSEMDVAAKVKETMFVEGADGFGIEPMIGAGPNAATILCRSTRRLIEEHDIVRLAVLPRYEGYCATIGRPIFVGGIDDKMKKRFEALCEARLACIGKAKAGVSGKDIENAGREVLNKYGFDYAYSGIHSIGCKEFESPIYGPGVEGNVYENTMLSIEIPLFNQNWGGLHLEDGIRVTQSGAVLMHNTKILIEK